VMEPESFRGSPPAYQQFESWLNPRRHRLAAGTIVPRVLWAATRLGFPALKEAVAGGQYDYPQGLFYGGSRPSEARRLVEAHLGRWIDGCSRVLHLDLHTGLGRWATHKLLADGPLAGGQAAWLRGCFGGCPIVENTSAGVAYATRGGLGRWCGGRFARQNYIYLCAEFGTYPIWQVLHGLRAENHAHHWEPQGSEADLVSKSRLRELFCPQSHAWRQRTLTRAMRLVHAALHHLGRGT
jgi:hypothetical protein